MLAKHYPAIPTRDMEINPALSQIKERPPFTGETESFRHSSFMQISKHVHCLFAKKIKQLDLSINTHRAIRDSLGVITV